MQRLILAYGQVKVGSPFDEGVLCGPVQSEQSVEIYKRALENAVRSGGQILFGGEVISDLPGNYVAPSIVAVSRENPVCQEEAFVPIVYVIKTDSLQDAIDINNSVAQGLSSSLFTASLENVFTWTG